MPDLVILLHGLARTGRSMRVLAGRLEAAGYRVAVIDYPSRRHDFATLARAVRHRLETWTRRAAKEGSKRVHFVGHSLGGLLLRATLDRPLALPFGRIVMLGTPNQGAGVIAAFLGTPLPELFYGKPTRELAPGSATLAGLGIPKAEIGIIAGNRRFHPRNPTSYINAGLELWRGDALPPHDGTVEVENTRIEGMSDFILLPAHHSFLPDQPEVARQTIAFLGHGRFLHDRGSSAP
ncbi:MAG: alpha/beta fold hydrolase [Alphaproteobacteria bacterium]|nr:alpha/beta fold hydrolase [Alphaproteobacteria bacterium]